MSHRFKNNFRKVIFVERNGNPSNDMNNLFKQMELRNESWTVGKILSRMDDDPDVGAWLLGDAKERMEAYDIALRNGFLTMDEIRKLERLPQRSGGDI